MSKKKEAEIAPFPQQVIDNTFWQYVQGVKDALEAVTMLNEKRLDMINGMIADKLEHIKKIHPGRRPLFDLKAEWVKDKIEIIKTMV